MEGNKIKIWIVEDQAIIAQNLEFTLQDLGYDVVGQSYDYESGLEAIENEEFELLFLDINLNHRNRNNNGLALAAALNERKKIPFIFLTAYNDHDTIKTAAALKPSAYIIKPTNATTIFATVQTAIENHYNNEIAIMPGEQTRPPDFFFNKIGSKIHKVFWKDVAKLESTKNYVSIKVFDSNTEYLIRGSLIQVVQNMIPKAMQGDFLCINRSIYLQKKAIKALYADTVDSYFGELPVSKDAMKDLSNHF